MIKRDEKEEERKLLILSMTNKQKEVYRMIFEYYKEKGKYPTLIEIGERTNKAKSTVSEMLKRMEKKGCIKIKPKHRGVRLLLGEITDDDNW